MDEEIKLYWSSSREGSSEDTQNSVFSSCISYFCGKIFLQYLRLKSKLVHQGKLTLIHSVPKNL